VKISSGSGKDPDDPTDIPSSRSVSEIAFPSFRNLAQSIGLHASIHFPPCHGWRVKFRTLLILCSSTVAWAEPPIVDDAGLVRTFQDKLGALADQKAAASGEALAGALTGVPKSIVIKPGKTSPAADYEALSKSVFLLGSVYKCGKCEHWHSSGTATAWSVSTDGLMITNYHVFKAAKGEAWGVCDFNGNVHPVKEIVAGNEAEDIALFRVGARELPALPVGPDAAVGADIHIVSHPAGHCFVETFGRISRYFRKPLPDMTPGPVMMAVTADYARGSSGAPVVNKTGLVVGMVSNTQTISYGNKGKQDEGPVQMVIKNCVSGAAIRALISSPAKSASTP